jgi:hypothetical protein
MYAPTPAYGGAPMGAGQSTNPLAITSLVTGILGCVCVLWIVAIVTGIIARKQIRESGGLQKGEGMALAGIILGGVWGALVVLWVIFTIAIGGSSGTTY